MHPRHDKDPIIASLLTRNEEWAAGIQRIHPGVFHHMAKGQQPKVLWIGCADSRVPESVITASVPGDIFVHRNIGNQFSPDDVSAASAVQFAVQILRVSHIVIVGHTNCGGVQAALEAVTGRSNHTGALGQWLTHLIHLARKHPDALELTEANVISTMDRVKEYINSLGIEPEGDPAYYLESPAPIMIVGMVYELETGRLKKIGHRDAYALRPAMGTPEEEINVYAR